MKKFHWLCTQQHYLSVALVTKTGEVTKLPSTFLCLWKLSNCRYFNQSNCSTNHYHSTEKLFSPTYDKPLDGLQPARSTLTEIKVILSHPTDINTLAEEAEYSGGETDEGSGRKRQGASSQNSIPTQTRANPRKNVIYKVKRWKLLNQALPNSGNPQKSQSTL